MTNLNKNKGSQFERDLVEYFKTNGFKKACRHYGAGRPDDIGDIDIGLPIVIESKNCKKIELSKWMDEVEVECKNKKVDIGVAIAKRRNYNVSRSYAIMPLDMFTRLLECAEGWLSDPDEPFPFEPFIVE